MATVNDVVTYANQLADNAQRVDADHVYGSQCVDLINDIGKKFFGIMLWGNAIDLLNAAAAAGLKVTYDAPGVNPKAGDVVVIDSIAAGYGHQYGHVCIAVDDSDGYTITTVEQNIDGNADALDNGGPTRHSSRDFRGVVGWFTYPYDDAPSPQAQPAQPASHAQNDDNIIDETGTFVSAYDIYARTAPTIWAPSPYVFPSGSVIKYNGYKISDYVWIRQLRADGSTWWIPTGEADGIKRIGEVWGEFSE